jgi:multiple antibiotic resistance protein
MIIKIAVTIFLLLNSIGVLPIFIALTADMSSARKIKTALSAGFVATIILLIFVWTGASLMDFFGLSIPAFEIGGGIILFKIGMEMLNCSVDPEEIIKEIPESIKKLSNAIVPLGVPLLAGPGAIAVVMTITLGNIKTASPMDVSISLLIAMAASLMVWIGGSYMFAKFKVKSLSDIIARLGGLFLVVLAVQMIINGYKAVSGI